MNNVWIKIPRSNNWPKLPTSFRWESGTLYIRTVKDGNKVIRKCDDVEKKRFENIKNLIKDENYLELFMEFTYLIKDKNTTQLGNFGTKDTDVEELFKYHCNNCDSETKFQRICQYRGSHSKCIICGYELSTIKFECDHCKKQSLFVKPTVDTDSDYKCKNCGYRLY